MAGGVWNFVTNFNQAEIASGNLVFAPTGMVTGDLAIACIAFRGTVGFTLPAGWNLVATQQIGNATLGTGSIGGALMAWIVWPSTTPDLTFVRTGGDVAHGTIRSYRGQAASPYDTGSANTLATAGNPATTPSITTAENGELLVAMNCMPANYFRPDASFYAVTDPSVPNPVNVIGVGGDPYAGEWQNHVHRTTSTGSRLQIDIGDAVKGTAGATGELRFLMYSGTNERHAMVVGAFKSLAIDAAEVSKLSRDAVMMPAAASAVVSKLSRDAIMKPAVNCAVVSKLSRYVILRQRHVRRIQTVMIG